MINIKLLILSILIPNAFGFIGNLLGNSSDGFDQIIQPAFTPPAIVFPIVWIILYSNRTRSRSSEIVTDTKLVRHYICTR